MTPNHASHHDDTRPQSDPSLIDAARRRGDEIAFVLLLILLGIGAAVLVVAVVL